MEQTFLSAIEKRRTYYAISKDSPISRERIRQIAAETIVRVPSAFNSQSARAVILFGESHDKVWDITLQTLRKIVPVRNFDATAGKIASFAAGYGTILYFDDTAVTGRLAEQFPTYRDNFPVWAEQANGMLQFAMWTALEQEGLGASLQHYNPLIDAEVKQTFKLPQSWKLIAEMPFGKPAGEPLAKTVKPAEERMIIMD